jgi:hypothetical protein
MKIQRLEQYTLKKRPAEVLMVHVESAGEPDQIVPDQIVIFKGFSSSLMRPTAFDPDQPVLAETDRIITLDRLVAPYNPDAPQYLQQGLTWEDMETLLAAVGV